MGARESLTDNLPPAIALGAIIVGLAFRAYVIALPTETLTARYLSDDYFYYLNVAYNIAHGRGSTFDGLTTTNGYQPLFLVCLVAAFLLGAGKLTAIHIGLAIHAAAVAAASVAAYRLLARGGAAWAGALTAGLLSVNLFFVLPTLTGFEMALALAAMLWALWCWQAQQPMVVVGMACGLAVLARVDTLVVPAIFALYLLYRRRTRDLALLVTGLMLVLGAWIVWSTLRFGSPAPDSGFIKAHYRGVHAAWRSLSTAFHELPRTIVPGHLVQCTAGVAQPALWATSTFILLLAGGEARRKDNRWLAATSLGIAAAYVLMTDPDERGALARYLFPVWAAVVFLVAQHRWVRRWWVVVLVLAIHVETLVDYVRWERQAPLPRTYVGVAHTLAPAAIQTLVAADERIGSFDAGALGYFSPRPVINLDGLANHDIVELRRGCRQPYADCLRDYMRSKGIRMLAGGTGFGWTQLLPAWTQWARVYESPALADGSRLVLLRLP